MVHDLISKLMNLDVKLYLENDCLRCNAPKGVLTKELLADIKSFKSEIVSFLKQANYKSLSSISVKKYDREEMSPLSFSQSRLWFLDQLDKGNDAYNITFALNVRGELNVSLLNKVFKAIVDRHEILRTAFLEDDGKPYQVVCDNHLQEFDVIDISSFSNQVKNENINIYLSDEANYSFDLKKAGLFRVCLIKTDHDKYILIVNMHHIVFDGWSIGVLIKEIVDLYSAYSENTISELDELKIQYIDYALWQKEYLNGDLLLDKINYWKNKLSCTSILELPTDHPRPPVQTHNGDTISFNVSNSILEKFTAVCSEHDVTLFMAMFSVFTVLLHKYTGQSDICVGTPIANRQNKSLESLIGFFVNTLVLRTKIKPHMPFTDLLEMIKQTTIEAFDNQDVPFENVVEALSLERQLSYSPLFQVFFVFQNSPIGELKLPGLELTPLEIANTRSKFDLTMELSESIGGLSGVVEYNTDLFNRSRIERLIKHFKCLLDSAINTPFQSIADMEMLPDDEKQLILNEWNQTRFDYAYDSCLHQLFYQQSISTPDAISLVCCSESLTYSELNIRSNQLAHYLISQGVEAENVVGLCVERSLEMIIGMLGILKANAAYVPLDPDYPQHRIDYMLEDSKAKVLLTMGAEIKIEDKDQILTIRLDDDWHIIEQFPFDNISSTPQPDGLAYIIYTSGSTGRPKGVAITHRNAIALIHWSLQVFNDELLAGMLASTSICFDLSVFEIFVPLCSGGKVLLVKDILHINDLSSENEIKVINTVPSAISQLVKINAVPESVKVINLAGESFSERLVKEIYDNTNVEKLFNLYGPSEDTTYSTYISILRDDKVTIGRPVNNTGIYLLDENLNPVALGVFGEVYIGGDGLCRGYFDRPDLTAEKFLPNAFSKISGARLYRTGDIGRYLEDGKIEYSGRQDHQVKVRGFRIELGEIESSLTKHPSIEKAIVIVYGHNENRRLVAYLVVSTQIELSQHEMRQHLKHKLPDYMIPSVFISLDALPLTPNGKIDRKALPSPDGQLRSEVQYIAPSSDTEILLTKIFQDLLKVGRIGVEDNFFELGGHSLLATQLVSRIRHVFEQDMPLSSIFEYATISGLAALIDAQISSVALPPIEVASRDQTLPLSFSQQRLWFLEQFDHEQALYNIPTAIRLQGVLNIVALEASINNVIARHEVLRTVFSNEQGQPLQIIVPHMTLSLLVTDLTELAEDKRELIAKKNAEEEVTKGFNLNSGPLIRCRLLRLSSTEHVLLFTVHHIVFDGWSTSILINEVATLYQANVSDCEANLADLEVQYVDYALWQREWLSGEVMQHQQAYWKKQLANLPGALELPLDYPRPAIQSNQGAIETFELNAELSEQVTAICKIHHVTPFMTLLSVFMMLMQRYSGQTDICVGTPIANRQDHTLEKLIGFFVNTLVIRGDLSADPSFEELLKQIKATALAAYAHQDMPFEQLVQALQPDRDLSRTPLYQVMFVLQNAPVSERVLPGLSFSILETDTTAAQFDLTFSLVESKGCFYGRVDYNRSLFKAETIQQMIGHYQQLLDVTLSRPKICLSQFSILNETEQHQQFMQWNSPLYTLEHQPVHHQIAMMAKQCSDAIAVVDENQQLSYAELDQRANQLARYLLQQGVEAETLIGIYLPRSVELIISILGVLKAGCAYVPLDTDYPQQRVSYMIKDAGIQLLICNEKEMFPDQIHCLNLKKIAASLAQQSSTDPNINIAAGQLAYVIYTSGSSGEPKGTLLHHQGLQNLVENQIKAFSIDKHSRVLQFSSCGFDASVSEIFTALCAGAQLHIGHRDRIVQMERLETLLQTREISTITLPPTLLSTLSPEVYPSIEVVVSAGEACNQDIIKRWQGQGKRFINAYGPTESTVCSSYCDYSLQFKKTEVSIGRPLKNLQLYILDNNLMPVPVGVEGELYISGMGLARGYINNMGLTAEKFIPNPFSSIEGSRMYRSGDLVRYQRDGKLAYMGRKDKQIKLRGYRIELGEIEQRLLSHEKVIASAVKVGIVKQHEVIMAYIVCQASCEEEHQGILDALKNDLAQQLPDYMQPSGYRILEGLPISINGKVDYKELPAFELDQFQSKNKYVAPVTLIEEQLVQMVSSVLKLGVNKVGVNDNFFDLGGHSLLALQLHNQLELVFKQKISLTTLFQQMTVKNISILLRSKNLNPIFENLHCLRDNGKGKSVYCVHPAGGLLTAYGDMVSQLKNFNVFGLQARGLEADEIAIDTIEAMAVDYIRCLKHHQPNGPYTLIGYSMGGVVAYEMAIQMKHKGEVIEKLVLIDPSEISSSYQQSGESLILMDFVVEILGQQSIKLMQYKDEIDKAEDHKKINIILDKSKELGLLSQEVNTQYLNRLYDVFKTNIKALGKYHAKPYSDKINIFFNDDDITTENKNRRKEWVSLNVNNTFIQTLKGDHYSIMKDKQVLPIIESIENILLEGEFND